MMTNQQRNDKISMKKECIGMKLCAATKLVNKQNKDKTNKRERDSQTDIQTDGQTTEGLLHLYFQ